MALLSHFHTLEYGDAASHSGALVHASCRTWIVKLGVPDYPETARSLSELQLASIVPCTRNVQDCGATILTASTGDGIVPAHITTSILLFRVPRKVRMLIAGLNFEGHRHPENETAVAGNVPDWMVPALKQGVSKVAVPVIPESYPRSLRCCSERFRPLR